MRIIFLTLALLCAPALAAEPETGKPAPDFALENKDGDTVKLSDYRGKKHLVIVFQRAHW